MNQSDAADATKRMAEAHQELSATDKIRTYKRVEDAVFSHAFEFIPDSAPYAVVDHGGEPLLVALDDGQLYLLTVDDLSTRTVGATTTLDVFALDAKTSQVRCTVEFIGVRTNADPMERRTTWIFDINGKFGMSIHSHVVPDSERVERDEDFAQALAKAIGWRPAKRSRRVVTVHAA